MPNATIEGKRVQWTNKGVKAGWIKVRRGRKWATMDVNHPLARRLGLSHPALVMGNPLGTTSWPKLEEGE